MVFSPSVVPDSWWASTGVVKQEDSKLLEAAGTGWWRALRAYLPDLVGNVSTGTPPADDLGLWGLGDTAPVVCGGWAGGEPQAETACGISSCWNQ